MVSPLAVLMPAVAAVVATKAPPGRLTTLTLAAFACSWVGDLTPSFIGKMAAFGLAHIAFSAAFWPHRHNPTHPAMFWVYTPAAAAAAAVLVTSQGSVAVGAGMTGYATLLILATLLGSRVNRIVGAGMVTFTVSDLFVAWAHLHETAWWVEPVAVATYVAAQVLIAAGVIRQARTDG